MKEIDYKIYKLLSEEESVSLSVIPKTVLNSTVFKNLLLGGILLKEKVGRGFKIKIYKEVKFREFFKTTFPETEVSHSKAGNIRKYRDSKARKVGINPVFFLRGFKKYTINQKAVDLKSHTLDFGLFAVVPTSINAGKVCFVENLESFFHAENLFGEDYLFLHKYGRIGKESIKGIQAEEIIVFVDYDFNGLDEYLRIRSVMKQARLYIPENYDDLYEKHSKSLSGKKARMSKRLASSEEPDVVKIREQVAGRNKFLEQEVLLDV